MSDHGGFLHMSGEQKTSKDKIEDFDMIKDYDLIKDILDRISEIEDENTRLRQELIFLKNRLDANTLKIEVMKNSIKQLKD